MLNFSNPSRSYDEVRHGVCFWGYDRTFEVSFFVEELALLKIDPNSRKDEPGFLDTFDHHRDRIRAAANAVYSRRSRHSNVFSYTVTDADC